MLNYRKSHNTPKTLTKLGFKYIGHDTFFGEPSIVYEHEGYGLTLEKDRLGYVISGINGTLEFDRVNELKSEEYDFIIKEKYRNL